MTMNKPKLSVICITYNHKNFIRDCLNGFIIQKTNFPFEVLIHDDASTDGTTDIIREYVQKYPDVLIPFYEEENQFKKYDFCRYVLYPRIKGNYVALCEGDDYWTDPTKLEKQVDFLESHKDYSLCFHPVKVHWEDERTGDTLFPSEEYRFYKISLDMHDLLKHNFIQTNSAVYRWRFHNDSLDLIPSNILPGDYFLHLLHAQVGKIGFLPDVMAVYRRQPNGLWSNAESDQWFCNCGLFHYNFFCEVEKSFGVSKKSEKERMLANTLIAALKMKDENLLNIFRNNLSEKYLWLLHKYFRYRHIKYIYYYILSQITYGKSRTELKKQRKILKKWVQYQSDHERVHDSMGSI